MAIEETLKLVDEVSAPAQAAAGALDGVSSAADATAGALAAVDGGAFANVSDAAILAAIDTAAFNAACANTEAALDAIDGESLDDAAEAADDTGDALDGAADAAEGVTKSLDEVNAELRKSQGEATALGGIFDGLGAAATGINQGLEIASKVGKGVKAVAKLVIAFGEAVAGAHALHMASRGMTDHLAQGFSDVSGIGEEVFGRIAEKAGPTLNAIGKQVSGLVSEFMASDTAAGAIDALAGAIEYIPPIIDAVAAGARTFIAFAQPGIDALGSAFGRLTSVLGEGNTGMDAAQAIGAVLGAVFTTVAQAIGFVVNVVAVAIGTFSAMVSAGQGVAAMIGAIPSAISDFAGGFASAGGDLVQGLIDGIMGGAAGVISAVTDLAGSAVSAAKSALGIASPSKVFKAIAGDTTDGMTGGLEDGKDAVSAAMTAMVDPSAAVAAANDNARVAPPLSAVSAQGGAPAGGGDTITIKIEINVNGSGPVDAGKLGAMTAEAVRVELEKRDRAKRRAA